MQRKLLLKVNDYYSFRKLVEFHDGSGSTKHTLLCTVNECLANGKLIRKRERVKVRERENEKEIKRKVTHNWPRVINKRKQLKYCRKTMRVYCNICNYKNIHTKQLQQRAINSLLWLYSVCVLAVFLCEAMRYIFF